MKETYYFSHDYHARNDIKLQALDMEKLGIYWCLIEMLYEESGYIKLSLCERIATALRTKCDTIKLVIKDFDLFENDGEVFWSNSVLRRLKEREEKSEMARKSANSRWKNANAMRTQCDSNAIKERKGKESKGKESKVNNNTVAFTPPLLEEIKKYCEERNNGVDYEKWYNFYSAKGWMIGKNKMKDWKAAVRTWEQNKNGKNVGIVPNGKGAFE